MIKPLNIIAFSAIILLAASAPGAEKGLAPKRGDGKVAISNYHEKEYREIVYREGGRYLPEGMKEIERIFRSRGDGSTHPIDPRLVELIDLIEDHFEAETVELISGYRSPNYNRQLKQSGRGVASESLHTKGVAADIHLDEVTEEELFEFAKSLGRGGAGIYPRYNFVHVDTGPVRSWREPTAKKRVLLGTENNPNPAWSAVTDKNEYRRGETVTARITNNDYGKLRLVKNVWTERYRKGCWCDRTKLEKKPKSASVKTGESIDYSWEIPEDKPHGKYRLVIFTSKDFSIPPAYSNEFFVKRKPKER